MSEPVRPVPSLPPAQGIPPGQPFIQPYTPKCSPCPCTTLQCGAKVVAIVEMILYSVILILLILVVAAVQYVFSNIEHHPVVEGMMTLLLAIGIIGILIAIASLIISIILLVGATKLNRGKCCVYIIGRSILTIIFVILAILTLFIGSFLLLGVFGIIIPISIYFILVVYCFTEELKFNPPRDPFLVPDQQTQPGVIRPLPNQDAPASGGL